MEVLIAKLNRWTNTGPLIISEPSRYSRVAEAIETVCPGATDLSSLGSVQLYDLILVLHETSDLIKDSFLPLWDKCFEQEKNDKLCSSIHGFTAQLRGVNNPVADTTDVATDDADTTDVATDDADTTDVATDVADTTDVATDVAFTPAQQAHVDIHAWHNENNDAINQWRKQQTYYKKDQSILTRYCCVRGYVDKLDLCKLGGYEFPDDLYKLAINGGHLEVVKWLYEHDHIRACAHTYAAAADFEILKYLTTKFGVSEDVCIAATMAGDKESVQYLIMQGGDAALMKKIAAERGHTEIVEWISLMFD